VRRGTDRQDVGLRVRGHRARHFALGEGPRQRHADRRDHRQRIDHEVAARRARGPRSRQPRVCCAAALATLDIVEKDLLPNVNKMGERLINGARELQKKYAVIGERARPRADGGRRVRERPRAREPAPEIPHELVGSAFKKGLLLLGCGKSSLRLAPHSS